jgi:hypothetical protein
VPLTDMTDDELDALLKRATESMLRTLDEHVDVEARLAEVKRKAAGRTWTYPEAPSPAGEASDRERNQP